jgi:hypothetical protein
MTPIALVLNLLLGALLVAALALGLRLDRRLRHLRDSQAGFIKAVAELDQAAARTQAGLQQWRDATDEARELLHDRIEKAKVQAAKLEGLLARPLPDVRAVERGSGARSAESRPERLAERTTERMPERARVRPPIDDDAEARAAALAETVLNLASAEPRRDVRPIRLEPRQPVRSRTAVDDDLFESMPGGAEELQRDLASAMGRRA